MKLFQIIQFPHLRMMCSLEVLLDSQLLLEEEMAAVIKTAFARI